MGKLGSIPSVEQSTGTSRDAVISQKAMTDILGGKADTQGSYPNLTAGGLTDQLLDLTQLDKNTFYPVQIPNYSEISLHRTAHQDGTNNPNFNILLKATAPTWGGRAPYVSATINQTFSNSPILKKIRGITYVSNIYIWLRGGLTYNYSNSSPRHLTVIKEERVVQDQNGVYITVGPEPEDGKIPNGRYETISTDFEWNKGTVPQPVGFTYASETQAGLMTAKDKKNLDMLSGGIRPVCVGFVKDGELVSQFGELTVDYTIIPPSEHYIYHHLNHSNYYVTVTPIGNSMSGHGNHYFQYTVMDPTSFNFFIDTYGSVYHNFMFAIFALQ